MKKIFSSWKFSICVLIITVILNIILLCQPVFGTYSGTVKDTRWYSTTYTDTKINFESGFATIEWGNGKDVATNVGIYQKVENKIVIITFSTNTDSQSLDNRKRIFTRHSVFSISWDETEGELCSKDAIWAQIGLGILEFVFLFRFISQLKNRNIIVDDVAETPQQEKYCICPNCGWQVFEEEKSCSNCGYKK